MGIVSFGEGVWRFTLRKKAMWKSPMTPPGPPLKHSENPHTHQRTVVQPIDTKLWIMIARTFFRPTNPP